MRDRIIWIDNARGICMLCVLLAHSQINHYYLHLVYAPWFLSLFFLISGYLFQPKSLKEDSLKITRSLVVPYFTLSTVLFCLGFDNISAISKGNIAFVLEKIKAIVLGYQLWFVACIIIVQFLFAILKHFVMKKNISELFISILLCISVFFTRNLDLHLPYYTHVAFFALAFFIFGDLLKSIDLSRYSTKIKTLNVKRKIIFSIATITSYTLICICSDNIFDMEFHFKENLYNNVPIYLFLSFLGMLCIFILSNMLNSNYLRLLGANSLLCFAFNGKALALAKPVLPLLSMHNTYAAAIILAFIESLILLLISGLINKYCPFIVGKKKKKIHI